MPLGERPFSLSLSDPSRFPMPPTKPSSTVASIAKTTMRLRCALACGLGARDRSERAPRSERSSANTIVTGRASAAPAANGAHVPTRSASRPAISGPASRPAPPAAIARPIAPAGRPGAPASITPAVQMMPLAMPISARPASNSGRPPAIAMTIEPSTTKPPAHATRGLAPIRSARRPSGSVTTTIANVVVESNSAVSSDERL